MALKTYFGSLAVGYIAEQGRDIKDVAQAIGKTPANQFPKWRNGRWTYIAPEKLKRIIDEIAGRDRQKRINLMVAYLIDMTLDEFRPLIDIIPKTGDHEEDSRSLANRWPRGLRDKLEAIGDAYIHNSDFMRLVETHADWAKKINEQAKVKKS